MGVSDDSAAIQTVTGRSRVAQRFRPIGKTNGCLSGSLSSARLSADSHRQQSVGDLNVLEIAPNMTAGPTPSQHAAHTTASR